MSVQTDRIVQDIHFTTEAPDAPLTSGERAVRWVMIVGFVSILILETWLLWQVWRLWA
jgi:hypothetical protein